MTSQQTMTQKIAFVLTLAYLIVIGILGGFAETQPRRDDEKTNFSLTTFDIVFGILLITGIPIIIGFVLYNFSTCLLKKFAPVEETPIEDTLI